MDELLTVDKYGETVKVSGETPWREASERHIVLRLGWRRVVQIELDDNHHCIPSHDHDFQVRTRKIPASPFVAIDVWVAGKANDSRALEVLRKGYEEVWNQLVEALGLRFRSIERTIEFLEMRLPRFLSKVDTTVITNAVNARLASAKTSSIAVTNRWLRLGPGPEGAMAATEHYLRAQENARATLYVDPIRGTKRSEYYWPLAMVLTILSTWFLPLTRIPLLGVALVLVLLMAVALWKSVGDLGWRRGLGRAPTIAAVTFFGIGGFGIAYAACALLRKGSLGEIHSLGQPFLVSTAIGIAGGILSENPKGPALIVAHVQLLLFLGGLVSILVILLRIAGSRGSDR